MMSLKRLTGGAGSPATLRASSHSPRGALGLAPRALVALALALCAPLARAALPGGSLEPSDIPKFQAPLVVPPLMPESRSDRTVDYQIAVRQFEQQILPPSLPATTVWSYGSVDDPGSFHYPAFTIEARVGRELRIKWVNDLKDPATGAYLPHLFAVDQTIAWANPAGECAMGLARTTDCAGDDPEPYTGPVPIVTHVHGAHTGEESDGHPEAWWLPAASDVGETLARYGSRYAQAAGAPEVPGQAIFRYPNDQAATTLWYHDHALGMTRLNVYAGPAGFYLLRGGPTDVVRSKRGGRALLPGPAPKRGDPPGLTYREIPLAIQDRSFDEDGSLFYAASREFFDGYAGPYATASDVPPYWNPEFFGNTMVVNGRTWPYLEVEARRYRFRILNGSNSRWLILQNSEDLPFWQIGADGGFLAEPARLDRLQVSPAERADVIVDFAGFAGKTITLLNLGPDEPFGGGEPVFDCDPDEDPGCFEPADPDSTGQVMQFRVVEARGADPTTPPEELLLPTPADLGAPVLTRQVSLNEDMSMVICTDAAETQTGACSGALTVPFGPVSARLGTVAVDGKPTALSFHQAASETPALGATEIWEILNFTEDAHPIHVHQVQFEVLDRQGLAIASDGAATKDGEPRGPEAWETGRKDTVTVYPGELARVKLHFDLPGEFVWHCHIVEHEDNDMMRPFVVQ